jgi:recombination protein RecT
MANVGTQASVTKKLAAGQSGAGSNVPAQKPKTLADQINAMVPQLARAAGNNIDPDKMARLALTEIRKTPLLAQSTPESFLGALMTATQLGLELGPTGHAYLLPFKNKGVVETQFIIGYKGMLDMVRRSNEVVGVPKARLVYENDLFNLEFTNDGDKYSHTPWYMRKDEKFTEPGKPIMGYLFVQYRDGGSDVFPMSMHEILKHKDRSKAKDFGPWVTDFEAMCKKTIVRANFAYLPMSVDDQRIVSEQDGAVARLNLGAAENGSIDVEFSQVPDTGEIPLTPEEVAEVSAGQEPETVGGESLFTPDESTK